MKVSLNTVKQFIDFELPAVDELVKRINEQLGGVEEVIDLGAKYKDAVIVKVVEADKHPNADRLNVTKIDDGGMVADVPRDENGLVQVVCGAPNVKPGMFAVWLPPKSTVPASFDDKEPFVLDARELRGVLSQGMLAAADELAIGSDHEGIIEINPDEWKPNDVEIKPGVSFAEAYGLDDTIIDIENKMFTHRPDLFGQLGVAREIAGILGHKFTSPDWYLNTPEFGNGEGLPLEVFNEASEKVPRIMFAAMKNVDIKPSPLWLQTALVAMGSKPISNIVDVTNYVMLLTAQPTHAYDYDKLRGAKIGARMAKQGEKIKLLNGKTYELTEDDIVIADGEGTIGLGGIMGGGDSEVDENTRNIVLEVATFDMYTVRKSSMRHGIFTDALTRFNKGQSPFQNDHIMNLLMMSVKDVSSAEQANELFDIGTYNDECEYVNTGEPNSANYSSWSQGITEKFINDRLGLKLEKVEIEKLLKNVEFKINVDEDGLDIYIPFWRTDIELPEDIVEEVGRLYGYDKLPRDLPQRSAKATPKNAGRELKQAIRESLARSGVNEVLTYSFVHENLMKKAGQNPEHAYQLSNALSPDLQFYRTSLTPSLLNHVHGNLRAGHDKFALFEIGKTHFKGEVDKSEPHIPNENQHVAAVVAYGAKQRPEGSAYFAARKLLEQIADVASFELTQLAEFDLTNDAQKAELVAPYEPKRSAVVVKNGKIWGVIGEFKLSVRRALKLPEASSGFEIHLDILNGKHRDYKPLSKYPSVTQDLSLRVASQVEYGALLTAVDQALAEVRKQLVTEVSLITIYQSDDDAAHKTITLRFQVSSYQKTLQDQDVTSVLAMVVKQARQQVAAEQV